MNKIILEPIGMIFTPYVEIENMPIQPIAAKGVKGYIEIYEEYTDGLKDLEGLGRIFAHYAVVPFP